MAASTAGEVKFSEAISWIVVGLATELLADQAGDLRIAVQPGAEHRAARSPGSHPGGRGGRDGRRGSTHEGSVPSPPVAGPWRSDTFVRHGA